MDNETAGSTTRTTGSLELLTPVRSVVSTRAEDGAGVPGGPAEAEPGAGSAGHGAVQRRRVDLR